MQPSIKQLWKESQKNSGLNVTAVVAHLLILLSTAKHKYFELFHFHLLPLWVYRKFTSNDQLPVAWIGQLAEHCTSIAEIMGSNPVQGCVVFRLSFLSCFSLVKYYVATMVCHLLSENTLRHLGEFKTTRAFM